MKVAAVILAAGASKRLGRPKQLVLVDDETLLQRTLRVVRGSRVASIAVVLGANRVEIEPTISGEAVIVNDAWSEGMASSVRAAVAWAAPSGAEGILLVVCDQLRLTSEHLDALLLKFESEHGTVGSAYEGTVGVPAIFERARFQELAALQGDRGARALLRGQVSSIDWPDGAIDLDTPADLERDR